jgi:hypothetical protein
MHIYITICDYYLWQFYNLNIKTDKNLCHLSYCVLHRVSSHLDACSVMSHQWSDHVVSLQGLSHNSVDFLSSDQWINVSGLSCASLHDLPLFLISPCLNPGMKNALYSQMLHWQGWTTACLKVAQSSRCNSCNNWTIRSTMLINVHCPCNKTKKLKLDAFLKEMDWGTFSETFLVPAPPCLRRHRKPVWNL